MQTQTIMTLKQLDEIVWFSSVGKKDSQAVVFVSNWVEAIKHCGSIEWENLCLEAANQYRSRIAEVAPNRLALWNSIAEEVKKVTIPLVKRKLVEIKLEGSLFKMLEDTVQWDIFHLCMESEYSDIFEPGFYASQGYWYSKGHFPCGWQGEFPKGKLIIF